MPHERHHRVNCVSLPSPPHVKKGIDERYDTAMDNVRAAEAALQSHLKDVRARLGGPAKEVNYIPLNKETHVIEAPESLKVCE